MIDRILTVAVACLLPAPLTYAGSVIEFEMRELGADAPVTGIMRISTQGRMTRLDIVSTGENGTATMMFRGDRGELIVVDHENKRYFLITKEQMDALAVQVSDAMKKMEEALASMPADQRAIAEKLMRD